MVIHAGCECSDIAEIIHNLQSILYYLHLSFKNNNEFIVKSK